MFQPEMFKENWHELRSKVQTTWPNLTDQDLNEINGNFETLVKKVNTKYNVSRDEIIKLLAPYVPATAGSKPSR